MKKPAYSPQAAATEARETALTIRRQLQDGQFTQARKTLEGLGKSDLQVKRRRIQIQPAEAVRLKRPVFICGLHRSGTTLLHDYLCAHYGVSFFQSAKVPENEGQFLQDVYMAERPFGGPGAFAFYPQMQFSPLKKTERARKTANRLLAQWDSWADGASPVLLEKSPPNIVRIPYFRSLFPEARFIVWTRDPRAVSLSTRKWHKLPIPQLMAHWNTAYMKAFQDLGEDCILARYEDFCEDPAGTARRIAAFCGLEKRTAPLPMAERFSEVKNSNAKYTADFPTSYRTRALVRAWEYFGYSFSSKTGTASND